MGLSYTLSEAGIKARDDLLTLVYQQENYSNDSKIEKDTGLRRDTIGKIFLKSTRGDGVRYQTLIKFFEKLLRKYTSDREKENKLDWKSELEKYLKDYDLKEGFYDRFKHTNPNLEFPRKLYKVYEKVDKDKKINNITKDQVLCPQNTMIVDNLVQILSNLDYKNQELEFVLNLEKNNSCLSFSILATNEITQKWILNRLLIHVITPENYSPKIFNLEKSGIGNNFESFLKEFSQYFNTSSNLKEILCEITQKEYSTPIILIIKNYRHFKEIQKIIIKDFWNPLCKLMSEKNNARRVIMFWVDECHPCNHCNSIVKLDELQIDQTDVEKWINKNSTKYNFPKNLLKYNFSERYWDWKNPLLTLDNICLEFGLDGITNIEEKWDWS